MTYIVYEVPGAPAVYAITHESERRYVGVTSHLSHRRGEHLAALRRGRHHVLRLQEDWDRDGPNAFTLLVLDDEATFQRELHWIRRVPRVIRYNTTPASDDIEDGAYVAEQAKGTTDVALRTASLAYEWKPQKLARRWAGVRWPLGGGRSSDLSPIVRRATVVEWEAGLDDWTDE